MNILPERVHVILISREPPPPQFARLCVSGAVSFLESADVRFSIEESRRIVWMDDCVGRVMSFPSPEIEASVANGMAAALVWRMPNHPYNLATGNTDLAVFHAKRAAQLIEMLGEPVYEAYARFLLAYVENRSLQALQKNIGHVARHKAFSEDRGYPQ